MPNINGAGSRVAITSGARGTCSARSRLPSPWHHPPETKPWNDNFRRIALFIFELHTGRRPKHPERKLSVACGGTRSNTRAPIFLVAKVALIEPLERPGHNGAGCDTRRPDGSSVATGLMLAAPHRGTRAVSGGGPVVNDRGNPRTRKDWPGRRGPGRSPGLSTGF